MFSFNSIKSCKLFSNFIGWPYVTNSNIRSENVILGETHDTLCLYNKLKNTNDMTGIVHIVFKYLSDVANFPYLFDGLHNTCNQVNTTHRE